MRFFLAVVSIALVAAGISCSSGSSPTITTGPALRSLTTEICRELQSDYSLSDKVAAQRFLLGDGFSGAQKVVDRAEPGHSHIVGIREYSDALDSVCPQTVRSFLGGQSLYDWYTD
jgi:hypothetical protein